MDFFAELQDAIFWFGVITLLVVSGLLVESLIRYRRKSAEKLVPDHHFQSGTILETIWMFIPLGILVTLLVLTMRSI